MGWSERALIKEYSNIWTTKKVIWDRELVDRKIERRIFISLMPWRKNCLNYLVEFNVSSITGKHG